MTERRYTVDRRTVLKTLGGVAGVAAFGIGSASARHDSVTVTTSDDPPWITAEVRPGPRTVISVDLDESVYGRWPDNDTSYVLEASIGLPRIPDEATDAFRIGWGGADAATRDGTAGGYIRRNVGTDADPDRFDTLEEDVRGLFEATESADRQSYEFVVNWRTPLPEAPKRIDAIQVNEVFGTDGGNGVQTENVAPVTDSTDVLPLTGN